MELTKEGIVRTEKKDGVNVVRFLSGQIRDETEIHRVLEELGKFIDSQTGVELLVNMEKLEYLSSAGLGNLVGLLKKSRNTGGVFKLCCLQESIAELFEVMRLDEIFEIFPTQDEALRSF